MTNKITSAKGIRDNKVRNRGQQCHCNYLVILHSTQEYHRPPAGAHLLVVKIHTSSMNPQLMKMRFHLVTGLLFQLS